MKAPSLNLYIAAAALWTIILGSGIALVMTSQPCQERSRHNQELRRSQRAAERTESAVISREAALIIGDTTPEAQALRASFRDTPQCLTAEVLRPCDTDWVTCVDDAWVVIYHVDPSCLHHADDRMGLRLLVDSRNGEVRSRYPEIDYFQDPGFCRNADDCLSRGGDAPCMNFVHAATFSGGGQGLGQRVTQCFCRGQQCVADGRTGGQLP